MDPGRDKCGLAVVDGRDGVLARGVVPTTAVAPMVRAWVAAHRPTVLVVGAGTAVRHVREAIRDLDVPLQLFPEDHTTLRARQRYFAEHPPRGWRRLVPPGLLSPPIPVDDYAAVLIAEDYLAAVRGKERARSAGNRSTRSAYRAR